ncbi:hypothetical protein LTR84_000459 [Exophiala bonariae]|uniref:Uncharacterized protein n=1 Tax=Exophiala bonariae TaxID=1690606 RepID=A0AAV9NT79_9EURO|nr:hypothetical protein LTR84_000459 [Exophiala bonariae]
MIPTTALIVLITVAAVCTITLLVAVWHTISTKRSPPEAFTHEEDKIELASTDSSGPLTIVPPARSPNPEAESPPPLSAGSDIAAKFPKPPKPPKTLSAQQKASKERDSMHEILDLYGNDDKKNAPPTTPVRKRSTTFADAKSKWAYFGRHEDYYVT